MGEYLPGKGVPPPGKGWYPLAGSTSPHPGKIPGQGGTPYLSGIACTCYAVGGVPLAFTQEGCLVSYCACALFPVPVLVGDRGV